MSSHKPPKKKVVVTSKKSQPTQRKKVTPTVSKSRSRTSTSSLKGQELIFGRKNYILMLAGVGLITLGMLLMLGGSMPSPDVWDPDIIYSFRRITLAPLLILAGLIIEIIAIFKKG